MDSDFYIRALVTSEFLIGYQNLSNGKFFFIFIQ